MKFETINKKGIANQIIDIIMEMIISKKLKAGDRIPTEYELMKQLGVGRSSVREALKALETTNLIVRRTEGNFVADPNDSFLYNQFIFLVSLKDISKEELYEIRCILEIQTAKLAAIRATEQNLEEILQWVKAGRSENKHEMINANINFHLAIAKATHNIALIELLKSIKMVLTKSRFYTNDELYSGAEISHTEIYKAIKKGDSALASSLMEKHLKGLYV